jgi:hypothetical protein
MSEQPTKMIPIDELRTEPGSEELAGSASMKPYLEVLKAAMGGQDTSPALDALAALPLEQRYVWRVVSALKWGLCDLDTESVARGHSDPFGTRPEERRRTVGIAGNAIFSLCKGTRWWSARSFAAVGLLV